MNQASAWSVGKGHILEEVDSTNNWLKTSAAPLGAWVLARRQSAGRGRGGNTWVSPPGNFYFSVVVPRLDPLPLVSLALGVALALLCHERGVPARLKWPNDLCLEGRKLGGILCETAAQGVIAGVGLNFCTEGLPEGSIALPCGSQEEAPADWAKALLARLPAWISPQVPLKTIETRWLDLWHGEPREFSWGAGQKTVGILSRLDMAQDRAYIKRQGNEVQVPASLLQESWSSPLI